MPKIKRIKKIPVHGKNGLYRIQVELEPGDKNVPMSLSEIAEVLKEPLPEPKDEIAAHN
jgi:hypothetical protein